MSVNTAEVYDPVAGTFTATGSMAQARQSQTATVLQDGRVLVAGGFDESYTALASAEIYDPSSGTFTATGSMTTARGAQTASLLPDGRVLVAGGQDASLDSLASAEIYDPATGAFSATGSMSTPRFIQAAALLTSGKVLIAGGSNDTELALASAEIFDPAAGTFLPTGAMTSARADPTASVLEDGKVLLAGGVNGVFTSQNSAEVFDPATGRFTVTGSMSAPRFAQSATVLQSGKVLVAGGAQLFLTTGQALASADVYDPLSGEFSATENSMTTRRAGQTATLLADGQVLLAGGADQFSSSGYDQPTATAELYTPANPVPRTIEPPEGSTLGGTEVTIGGSEFVAGSTVTIGGTACAITATTATTLTCVTGRHEAGAADVIVSNPGSRTGTLPDAFQYVTPTTTLTVTARAKNKKLKPAERVTVVKRATTNGELTAVKAHCYLDGNKITGKRAKSICKVRTNDRTGRIVVRPACSVHLKVKAIVRARAPQAKGSTWTRTWRVKHAPRTHCGVHGNG
ncbi:MAG: IPT/TIG domain-containing protein [Actinobacteria bacterium]|nr:IPT/TIG domain-containing protein [Actinomycetota bacterium]